MSKQNGTNFHDLKKYNSWTSTRGKKKYRIKKVRKVINKDGDAYWAFVFYERNSNPRNQVIYLEIISQSSGHFDANKISNTNDKKIEKKKKKKISKKAKPKKGGMLDRSSMRKQIIDTRENNSLKTDLINLEKFGCKAEVKTNEGNIRKLFIQFDNCGTNKDNVYEVYLNLQDYDMTKKLEEEFKDDINEMNEIVESLDTISLQFNKFSNMMPPLNQKGFKKLEPFQENMIKHIDAKKGCLIVCAATGSGKSVGAGYLYKSLKFRKILVVLPTDALTLQTAAYIYKTTSVNPLVLTTTYKTHQTREPLLNDLKTNKFIVGTAETLINILPLHDKLKFDALVFDEIHKISDREISKSSDMELIAKLYSNAYTLALSATIGNPNKLKNWFLTLGHSNVDIIECKKRFFNLQLCTVSNNKSINIHPLSLIDIEYIRDGSILERDIRFTSRDIWILYQDLKDLDLKEADIYTHFKKTDRITLDQSNNYCKILLKFMVDTFDKNKDYFVEILKKYKNYECDNGDTNLVDFIFSIKELKRTPVMFFHQDSNECLDIVYKFYNDLITKENEKYPNLVKEREKIIKKNSKIQKKKDKMGYEDFGDKKLARMAMENEKKKPEDRDELDIDNISLADPHPDFTFTPSYPVPIERIKQWLERKYKRNPNGLGLKKYFNNRRDKFHPIIDLLLRGVGVYVTGLPDAWLRIVQQLASQKKLCVIFADYQLSVGISLSVKSVVILRDPNLSISTYQQMSGRAGRRGLDTEGYVYNLMSKERINYLSTGCISDIKGADTRRWTVFALEKLIGKKLLNMKKNFLQDGISDEESLEFYNSINENVFSEDDDEEAPWGFCDTKDQDLNRLLWDLGDDEDCFRIAFLIQNKYFEKIFSSHNPTEQKAQIDFAHFISHFIDNREVENVKIPEFIIGNKNPCLKIKEELAELALKDFDENCTDYTEDIDGDVFFAIQKNKIEGNKRQRNKVRDKLFKFTKKLIKIQHYYFYKKKKNLTRLIGKLLTRIHWIFLDSSPLNE